MAKGRMVVKPLIEDLDYEGVDKVQRYHLFIFHVFADDEGFLTVKDAKNNAECSEEDLEYLEKKKFIKIRNKIVKCRDWDRYQKIRIERAQPSNIKHRFLGKSRKELQEQWQEKLSKKLTELEKRKKIQKAQKGG